MITAQSPASKVLIVPPPRLLLTTTHSTRTTIYYARSSRQTVLAVCVIPIHPCAAGEGVRENMNTGWMCSWGGLNWCATWRDIVPAEG